jgi:ring-1,2-phenylacetyl-CoA epoxidase subunit PaaC
VSAGPGPLPVDGALDPRLELLLALADDELIIGHRHSEWTGWVPHLEEDLAFSSIAQDEMAHARLLYGLALPSLGEGWSEDRLALGREPNEYRNAVLCERPNRDWGYSLARQFLYDTADEVRTHALAGSSWRELADVMTLVRMEEAYHLEHAREWFGRLADGPVAAREHLAAGLEAALPDALGLFEPLQAEEALLSDGVLPRPGEALLAEWLARAGEELERVSLDYVLERHTPVGDLVPTSSGEVTGDEVLGVPGVLRIDGRWVHQGGFSGEGGRRGRHSDDFAGLWEDLTGLYRTHPGATW